MALSLTRPPLSDVGCQTFMQVTSSSLRDEEENPKKRGLLSTVMGSLLFFFFFFVFYVPLLEPGFYNEHTFQQPRILLSHSSSSPP